MRNIFRKLVYTFMIIAGVSLSSCKKKDAVPNIVIILVDDMGYGDPGCYNPESKIPTPNIDVLAEEGMRFTDAHATGPLCHLSRYGLITGRYPFRTDVTVWSTKATIEEDRVTLPSMLKDRGYHTAMVGKWHLGFNEKGYENTLSGGPVDRGFDSYFGIRASTDIPPYFYIRNDMAVDPPTEYIEASSSEDWSPIQGAFWREGGIAPNLELKDVLPRFTNEAIGIIEGHKSSESPLMLYLAYPAPHTPWLPSKEFEGKSGAGMYGDFLMMVDAEIGKVLHALDKAGMKENTVLLFSSDNGPVWYDEDAIRLGHDSSIGLRGMKGDAWEAGHRMPFIVRWPGKVKAGSLSEQTICFTDVLATMAEISGDKKPEGAGPDSYSFLPVILGKQARDKSIRPPVLMESANGTMLIRKGDWKLIDHLGSGGFSKPGRVAPEPEGPSGQLYNMAIDPGETTNLYMEQPDTVEQLKKEMKQIMENGY
ncbi:MAG: arylsulfatase [Bacteroidales bacterium]|jgi:arylsulfatase A|nr:arylsulfatase [Bacteroidales bacterium]